LVQYATQYRRGMVGSSLRQELEPEIIQSRGLAWRKWRASTLSVDWRSSATVCPPPDEVERRLDSPSGASMYVTRDCIERIGLMDERYFLYFEDLEWGLRAKKLATIGYAHRSIVMHEGGTTIGSATTRRGHSPLSVYLDFRNRLLFVRQHFTAWLPWTFMIELAEIIDFGRMRAFRNMSAALRGMGAGLLGKTGRPDNILRAHVLAAHPEKS
jgi:N-acetylglucosaminyl-diphospho-decaprenol L-rhamnosyltransferase